MFPHDHDWDHGGELGQAPDQQQLPGVHAGDVLDHHIAGGEAESSQDRTAVAKIDEWLGRVTPGRPVISSGILCIRIILPRQSKAAVGPLVNRTGWLTAGLLCVATSVGVTGY